MQKATLHLGGSGSIKHMDVRWSRGSIWKFEFQMSLAQAHITGKVDFQMHYNDIFFTEGL